MLNSNKGCELNLKHKDKNRCRHKLTLSTQTNMNAAKRVTITIKYWSYIKMYGLEQSAVEITELSDRDHILLRSRNP